jgi:F-type H+-transporting ATPase subunit gamma
MLATKAGTRAYGSVRAAKPGVKPAKKNPDGARRAYPGKGALQALGLRRHTVKTIEKITGTMKLVAQAQLLGTTKKARETADFFLNVKAMMDKFPLPAVEEGKSDKVLTALITSNRGLCGSLNSQLVRDASRMPETQGDAKFFVIGDKGATALEKKPGMNTRVVASTHPGKVNNFLDFSRVGELLASYEYDRVMFVFNKLITNNTFEITRMFIPSTNAILEKVADIPFDFEEGQEELFRNFQEFALASAVHYTFYQSAAAETLSRRNAMDGANKNCKELKLKLSIVFNKLRQALITTDLIEITTGTTAVEEMS